MEASTDRVVLRSYRLAFELERRIHRIDRFRIPLPYGLPLEALGYGAALLLVVLAARQIPLIGTVLDVLPLPVQLVFLPGAGAHLLCRTTHDGRRTHEVLGARLVRCLRPKHLVALEPVPRHEDLRGQWTAVADERGPRLVRGTVRGPGSVTVCVPVRASVQPRRITLQPLRDGELLAAPRDIALRSSEELHVA